MNWGQNLWDYMSTNLQPVVLIGIVVIGVFLIFKKKFTELIGFVIVSIIAVGLVFGTEGVKGLFLDIFNKIFGI